MLTNLSQQQIQEETRKIFNTDKVKIIFEILLPSSKDFDQIEYAKVFLKSYYLFNKKLITFEELIEIGSLLQVRKLPQENLGAFNKYNLFKLFELCNSLSYAYFYNNDQYSSLKESLLYEIQILLKDIDK